VVTNGNIAIVCLSHFRGGMELDAIKIAMGGVSHGLSSISLICRKNSFIDQSIEKDSIPVERLKFLSNKSPLLAIRLRKIFTQKKITSIILLGSSEMFVLWLALIGMSHVRVVLRHGTTMSTQKNGLVQNRYYSRVDNFIAISRHLEQNIYTIFPGFAIRLKTSVIYGSPTHLPKKLEIERNKDAARRIMCVGRVQAGKGQGDLIKAVEGLDIGVDFFGEFEPAYKETITNEVSDGYKHSFFGHVDDISSYFANYDVFVAPSYGEGLGLSVIEGLSFGKVCIVYDNTVFPEYVDLGFHIHLVRTGHIGGLKKAIIGVFNDLSVEKERASKNISLASKIFDPELEVESIFRLAGMKKDNKDKRINVIAWGLLGDFIMRTSVLRALKQRFPDSLLYVSVDYKNKQIAEMCPAIDRVDVVNRSRENLISYLLSKIFISILYMLRASDLCIDLYGGKSSNLLTRLSRSKDKIIVAAGSYSFNGKIFPCKRRSHSLVELPMNAMCPLSREVYSLLPYINAPQSAEYGEGAFRCALDNISKSYVINLGAGDAKKIPDINTLVLLCSHIADKHGLTPILLKNPDSDFYQKQLVASFEAARLNYFQMIDVLDFHQIAYLLKRSRFFVTPDTGLMHLAIGLGVPTLALFPYTNPALIETPGANLRTCFVESLSGEYHDGHPVGDRDIPVELMIRQFEILYRKNHLDRDTAV